LGAQASQAGSGREDGQCSSVRVDGGSEGIGHIGQGIGHWQWAMSRGGQAGGQAAAVSLHT
jgi:hypothetical protein